MKDDRIHTDSEFPRDRDPLSLSDEEMKKVKSVLEKMLEMGIGAVYGVEDEGIPDAVVDCEARIHHCRAVCCTYRFALTKDEVCRGRISYDASHPFFMNRDEDGYCSHLDRHTFTCTIW